MGWVESRTPRRRTRSNSLDVMQGEAGDCFWSLHSAFANPSHNCLCMSIVLFVLLFLYAVVLFIMIRLGKNALLCNTNATRR